MCFGLAEGGGALNILYDRIYLQVILIYFMNGIFFSKWIKTLFFLPQKYHNFIRVLLKPSLQIFGLFDSSFEQNVKAHKKLSMYFVWGGGSTSNVLKWGIIHWRLIFLRNIFFPISYIDIILNLYKLPFSKGISNIF